MFGGKAISPGELAHQKLMDLLKQGRDARKPYDAEAWQNIAFYIGEQYTEWSDNNIRRIPRKRYDPEKGQIDESDLPRPVLNKIQHFILTAHSETLRDKPSADVLPATDDYGAMLDQDVNKAYLNYVMEPVNVNWDLQLAVATLWALITPAGWLKWVWDPVLKRPDVIPVTFFDLTVDPYVLTKAGGFSRARWVIHTQFMSPDMVEDTYDVKIQKSEIGHQDVFRAELLRSMGSAPLSEGVEVHELWMKPSGKHPQGLYAIFTNTRLLKLEEKLPYKHLTENGGMLPFTQLGSLLRPDSMYYLSPVTALRPAQMVWNRFIAQAILINNNFAAPKWWVPEEIELSTPINSSPGQVLKGRAGNTGLKPELIQPPSMPDMSRLLDIFEKQMMHVVSVHEVSQGQVPGRVEAAKAIELLQTSDTGRYKHLLDTIDQTISIGYWQTLMLARQFESPQKMVMAYTPEGAPMVKRWHTGAVDPGLRIKVVRMGGLGRTRAERQDTILLYVEKGLIAPNEALELLEVPMPSFTNERAEDMRMARSENEILKGGNPIEPGSWENHGIHIREHNRFRKTMEFQALSKDVKAMFEHHVNKHKQLQIGAALELAQLMRAQQGIDPNAPTPAAPQGAPGQAAPPAPGEQNGAQAPPESQQPSA